jgi:hypothetical protein
MSLKESTSLSRPCGGLFAGVVDAQSAKSTLILVKVSVLNSNQGSFSGGTKQIYA